MPYHLVITIAAAIGWWLGGLRKRRETRRRTTGEINSTLETGLPSPETALGRRAREVRDAQESKLHSPPPVHGTARWAKPEDAVGLLEGNLLASVGGTRGLSLGTLVQPDDTDTGLPLVARYPGHLLTVAGTGQGKAVTQIVQNLLTYNGTAVVLDPKGELYDLTAARRREFGRVFRLAPLAKPTEPRSARYNPLDELDDPRERPSRARRLAEMLIVRQAEKGAADAAFFENEAVNLLTSIILSVMDLTQVSEEARKLRTLAEVRRICTMPMLGEGKVRKLDLGSYLEDHFATMMMSRDPLVARLGGIWTGVEPKLLSSFRSEINSNLAFFDDHPGFAEVTAKSDFLFADIAKEPTTVYITIPLKSNHTSFRYVRAMIGLAFAALEEQREATEASVLFVLDEFAALRDMPFMRDAVAQMRSSGAWFWFFVQDVAQLDGVYKDWANVFLSQTDHQIFFGATVDPETKRHISSNLGVTTYAWRDPNVSWAHSVGQSDSENSHPTQIAGSGDGRNIGQSVNISDPVKLSPRALLTPFEVGTYLSQRQPGETHPSTTIIFSKQAGGYPVKARRAHWRDAMRPAAVRSQPTNVVTMQRKAG